MSYKIKKQPFEPVPEGVHAAVCVDVVDLGIVDGQYGPKPKIKLVFETNVPMKDGRPFLCSKRYTPSLDKKATLFKDLKSWRGQEFTPDELKEFELENVLGKPCQILITHDHRDGDTFANITAILKATTTKLMPTGKYERVKDRPGYVPPGKTEQGPPEGSQESSGEGEYSQGDPPWEAGPSQDHKEPPLF